MGDTQSKPDPFDGVCVANSWSHIEDEALIASICCSASYCGDEEQARQEVAGEFEKHMSKLPAGTNVTLLSVTLHRFPCTRIWIGDQAVLETRVRFSYTSPDHRTENVTYIVVSFRGTQFDRVQWHDLFVNVLQNSNLEGYAPLGFSVRADAVPEQFLRNIVMELSDDPSMQFILCGHSLGGAVSSLVGVRRIIPMIDFHNTVYSETQETVKDRIRCISFGSPMIWIVPDPMPELRQAMHPISQSVAPKESTVESTQTEEDRSYLDSWFGGKGEQSEKDPFSWGATTDSSGFASPPTPPRDPPLESESNSQSPLPNHAPEIVGDYLDPPDSDITRCDQHFRSMFLHFVNDGDPVYGLPLQAQHVRPFGHVFKMNSFIVTSSVSHTSGREAYRNQLLSALDEKDEQNQVNTGIGLLDILNMDPKVLWEGTKFLLAVGQFHDKSVYLSRIIDIRPDLKKIVEDNKANHGGDDSD